MLKEAKIILPVAHKDRRGLFLYRMVEEFGGYTATEAVGGRRAPDGRVVAEPVIVVTVAIAESAVPKFRALATDAAWDWQQEAVYIVLPNGNVETATMFVTALPERECLNDG